MLMLLGPGVRGWGVKAKGDRPSPQPCWLLAVGQLARRASRKRAASDSLEHHAGPWPTHSPERSDLAKP